MHPPPPRFEHRLKSPRASVNLATSWPEAAWTRSMAARPGIDPFKNTKYPMSIKNHWISRVLSMISKTILLTALSFIDDQQNVLDERPRQGLSSLKDIHRSSHCVSSKGMHSLRNIGAPSMAFRNLLQLNSLFKLLFLSYSHSFFGLQRMR